MQVDPKQSSGETHRILFYALAASLAAHLCGLLYFQSDTTVVTAIPKPSVLNVTLKASITPQRVKVSTTEVQEAAQEIVTTISMHDSPQQPIESQRPLPKNRPKIAKLKTPSTAVEMRLFLQEVPAASNSQTTVNGAVVLNQTLLSALQQNPGIKKFTTAFGDSPLTATYDAGSWTERVQFGNKCFYVKSANPLEPYSNEVWYRTACL